jgi:hypothetical protein
MTKPLFDVMKVFDCQKMPADIRRIFFDYSEAPNDCYLRVCINDSIRDPDDPNPIEQVWDWLIANGADPGGEDTAGEEVLVNHWW